MIKRFVLLALVLVVLVAAAACGSEEPAPEPSLHGLWRSYCNVLTPADDPDTFDPVTGGWPLRALLCRIYKT